MSSTNGDLKANYSKMKLCFFNYQLSIKITYYGRHGIPTKNLYPKTKYPVSVIRLDYRDPFHALTGVAQELDEVSDASANSIYICQRCLKNTGLLQVMPTSQCLGTGLIPLLIQYRSMLALTP